MSDESATDLRRAVKARREAERRRIRQMAEERRRALDDLRRCQQRLVMAAIAGELSEREVAAIAGVPRTTLRGWYIGDQRGRARQRALDAGS